MEIIINPSQAASKLPEKVINSYFLSDITSEDFLRDPLTVLSFDHNSVVPYMKSIHYFIELAENLLKSSEISQNNQLDYEEAKENEVQVSKVIDQTWQRIKRSAKARDHSQTYSNFMTLQCIYLVLKNRGQNISEILLRELVNTIVITASTDIHGNLVFAFDQFIQYLQTSDRVRESNLFCDLFFGQTTCWGVFSNVFSQNAKESKSYPPIFRIHNAFEHRIHLQRATLSEINRDISDTQSRKDFYINQDQKLSTREL